MGPRPRPRWVIVPLLLASIPSGCGHSTEGHTEPSPRPVTDAGSPTITPSPPLALRSPDGSVQHTAGPVAYAPTISLHPVAVRVGPIEVLPRATGMTLLATLPYPVGADGRVVTVAGVDQGLVALHPDEGLLEATIAGTFPRAGHAWLLHVPDQHTKPDTEGLPLAYEWSGEQLPLGRPPTSSTRSRTHRR